MPIPPLIDIVQKHSVVQHQSKLIDFKQSGVTYFQYPITDWITELTNLEPTSNYKFKRSRVYLIVKDISYGGSVNYPTISIPNIMSFKNLNSNPVVAAGEIVSFKSLKRMVIASDMEVGVNTAATGFTSFTGYVIVEGSFVNMAL